MEILRDLGYRGEARIVKNIPVDEAGYPYLVKGIEVMSSMMEDFSPSGDEAYFLAVVRPAIKRLIFDLACERFDLSKVDFPQLIHPSCQVSSTVKIGEATHIEHNTILSPYAVIGRGINIKRGGSIGYHTQIDDFVTINPGVTISGTCHVESEAVIGVGATIFDNVKIGRGSIIGAGSLVTKSIPAGVVAYGNPCKVIREL